jgi:5'-nucleotidase
LRLATTAPTCALQLAAHGRAARPGVAFSLVRKLLAFNPADVRRTRRGGGAVAQRPGVGPARVPLGQAHGLPIERGVFTRARTLALPAPAGRHSSCRPTRPTCARRWPWACPRRGSCPHAAEGRAMPIRDECASPSTATPCCSPTRPSGCSSATGWPPSRRTKPAPRHEPLPPGPFKPLLRALHQRCAADPAARCACAPRW